MNFSSSQPEICSICSTRSICNISLGPVAASMTSMAALSASSAQSSPTCMTPIRLRCETLTCDSPPLAVRSLLIRLLAQLITWLLPVEICTRQIHIKTRSPFLGRDGLPRLDHPLPLLTSCPVLRQPARRISIALNTNSG